MKSIKIFLLALSMSTQVFASEKFFLVETPIIAPSSHADFTINTCLDKFLLEKKIAFHPAYGEGAGPFRLGAGGFLLIIGVALSGIPAVGVPVVASGAAILTNDINKIHSLNKLISLIHDAEKFLQTGEGTTLLRRSLKKVRRKTRTDLTMLELSEAISEANNDLSNCPDVRKYKANRRKFRKEILISVEE